MPELFQTSDPSIGALVKGSGQPGRNNGVKTRGMELSEISGASVDELKQGKRGRVGNPAKRFAVWALRERTLMSYAQIGRQMKMSESAVAKDLAKSRKQIELFERWSSEWLTRHEEKFEVVLPAKG